LLRQSASARAFRRKLTRLILSCRPFRRGPAPRGRPLDLHCRARRVGDPVTVVALQSTERHLPIGCARAVRSARSFFRRESLEIDGWLRHAPSSSLMQSRLCLLPDQTS